MSPARLTFILTVALRQVRAALRTHLARQATRQLQARYPLAGCSLTQADGSSYVTLVGRN